MFQERIIEVIKSKPFKSELKRIATHYPNIKQELFIRNAILELLNADFQEQGSSDLRAFAEKRIPRGKRYDLSIVDRSADLQDYNIEFKYQFGSDLNHMKAVGKLIQEDLFDKKSDLFILIINEFNREVKSAFDHKWGITTNLSRYLSPYEKWYPNLLEAINSMNDIILRDAISIPIEGDQYPCTYHFYLISHKSQLD